MKQYKIVLTLKQIEALKEAIIYFADQHEAGDIRRYRKAIAQSLQRQVNKQDD